MGYLKAISVRFLALIHCVFIKCIHFKQFYFHMGEILAISTHFTFEGKNGKIYLGKGVGIRRGTELTITDSGKIVLEDRCFLNKNCLIAAHESVIIGQRTKIGPNVLMFDHDYDYKNKEEFLKGNHKTSPINIGSNCWIGAGCIILKGTTIGDNCIIGAGSVVKGEIKPNTMIVQKREEKFISLEEEVY